MLRNRSEGVRERNSWDVIVAGLLCWRAVDGLVEDIARSIRFSQGMEPLESAFQELILRRGSRVIWLWTFLPASIGWSMATKAVRKLEGLGYWLIFGSSPWAWEKYLPPSLRRAALPSLRGIPPQRPPFLRCGLLAGEFKPLRTTASAAAGAAAVLVPHVPPPLVSTRLRLPIRAVAESETWRTTIPTRDRDRGLSIRSAPPHRAGPDTAATLVPRSCCRGRPHHAPGRMTVTLRTGAGTSPVPPHRGGHPA